jgi:hypothetical protein
LGSQDRMGLFDQKAVARAEIPRQPAFAALVGHGSRAPSASISAAPISQSGQRFCPSSAWHSGRIEGFASPAHALDARHDTGNEPARLAHLDHGDQRAVRIEASEGSGRSTSAWGCSIGSHQRRWTQYPRRRPIGFSAVKSPDGRPWAGRSTHPYNVPSDCRRRQIPAIGRSRAGR